MKILRFVFALAIAAVVLALLAIVLAIAPVVQTAVLQHELAKDGRVSGTVDSVSAGFGEVDIEQLHLKSEGAVLTLPSLKAKLGLTRALVARDVRVTSLEASGWTLDLSGVPGADSPQKAAMALTGMITRLQLPFTSSWDGVDLEGDVLLATANGGAPSKLHLVLSGGGLAPGKEGSYTLEAAGVAPWSSEAALSAHGTLLLAMDQERRLHRISVNLILSGTSSNHSDDLTLAAGTSLEPGASDDVYTVDLTQGSRHLLGLKAQLAKPSGTVGGTWTVDLRDADLAQLVPTVRFPRFTATGQGRFEADGTFTRIKLSGELKGGANHLGVLAPALETLGPVGLHARFQADREGSRISFSAVEVTVANDRPVIGVRSLQPFTYDYQTQALAVSDPARDWLEAQVPSLPFSWINGVTGSAFVTGPDLAGTFGVSLKDATVSLHSRGALVARGVHLQVPALEEAPAVDLSFPLGVELSPAGWKFDAHPLVLSRDSHPLATVGGTAASAWGDGQALTLTVAGDVDSRLLLAPARLAALGPMATAPVHGDLTVTLAPGAATEMDAKFQVAPDDAHQVSGSVHAELDGAGGVQLQAPLKLTTGKSVSDFDLEGGWTAKPEGPRLDLTVTGGSVSLAHLRFLAGAVLATPTEAGSRDTRPFWGTTTGRLTVSLDHLRTEDVEYAFVGAIFTFEPNTVHLASGHGGPPQHALTNVESTLTFDSAAPAPYHLTTTASSFDIEGKDLVPAKPGEDPLLEGHYKVDGSLVGDGNTLEDLFRHTRKQLKLTSTSGIVHLLKVDVADALPEAKTPVADTAAAAASAFTAILGAHKEFGQNAKLTRNAEAVIDFTNQVAEIGCDQITIAALADADGSVEVTSIDMEAGDEFLRGTGALGASTKPLAERPLQLTLTYGAKGELAKLLTTAGLQAPGQDAQGFTVFKEPIHLGGTLAQVDSKPWHDLLAKAATAPPPPAPAKAAKSP